MEKVEVETYSDYLERKGYKYDHSYKGWYSTAGLFFPPFGYTDKMLCRIGSTNSEILKGIHYWQGEK